MNLATKLRDANTGDTILLTTGTYTGTFNINIVSGLTLKAKAGNAVIVDGGFILSKPNTTIRGIEILNSAWTARDAANLASIPFGVEVVAGATGCKVINCLIHDTDTGVIIAADGAEVTGNLFWNIGATDAEHCIYTNNDALVSDIRDNILGATYSGWGLQAYSGAGGKVNNIHANYNVSIWEKTIVYALGVVTSGVQFQNNEGYKTLVYIGQASQNNEDVSVTDNYLMYSRDNGVMLDLRRWNTPTVTGNTFIADSDDGVLNYVPATGNPLTCNGNTYIMQNVDTTKFVNDDGTAKAFATWKADHNGADTTSTLGTTLPASNRIVMHANPVDAERAWIAVYNWENSASVSLDLSSLSLSNGTDYILRQAQDPKADTQTFTYNGSAVSMSMAAVDHSVATPTGAAGPIVATTFPAFGAWLLEKA